jgi:Domain of unknown function (DUF222)/HNH endonuclease
MMSSKIHDGPGVTPGRYGGEAIPLHDGPTPEQLAFQQHKTEADGLAGRICVAAAETARSTSLVLELVGEFDAIGGMKHWIGFKSLAHWLSWSCAMTPGVAWEHVRVAKALRRMPTIAGLLREGRLSYSKVREVTRVVDVVDEARLAGLAVTATAAQLAKMISGFRSADGKRIPQQHKRSVTWQQREDGMIDVRARLPKEEAAVLIAAMDAARDQFGPPPPKPDPAGDCGEPAPGAVAYSKADAVVDVARVFLNTAPQDRSGEDRSLVVVHVSAESLARSVPAGTPAAAKPASIEAERGDAESKDLADVSSVPAGTPTSAVCHIAGIGAIETATAQKLACDSPLLGAVVDKHGHVLAMGRTRRLVTKTQRRALMIRDGMCRYPGCHQTRHLKAHHRVPWITGGRTDLDNLILLCQWHHTAVHEGGVTITKATDSWLFTKPDGQSCDSWVSDENLARHLDFARRRAQQQTAKQDQLAEVDSFHHPDARTIRPRWTGEPFDLHSCVQALFTIKLPKPGEDQDQQAA